MRYTSALRFLLVILATVWVVLNTLQLQNGMRIDFISQWSYQEIDHQCNADYAISAQFNEYVGSRLKIWKTISNEEILEIQNNLQKHLENFDNENHEREYSGRGIVYSAFPGVLRMISVSIKFLRSFGCTLPVEIWF